MTKNTTVDVTGGFRLMLAGTLTIANQFEISGAVEFKLSAASIELIVNGNLELAGIGRLTLIDSGFRIDSKGLIARFEVELDAKFGSSLGLNFSVSAIFELNTTTEDQPFGGSTVKRGFLLSMQGVVNFLGFAKAEGSITLAIGPSESSFEFDVDFDIAEVLAFKARGGAKVVNGQGVVLVLDVGISMDMSVITLDAQGKLKINTTNRNDTLSGVNVGGKSFSLSLSGKIEVMKVFGINAGFDIIVKDDFWSVSVLSLIHI